ncbi:MAG TPA: hypothetical protein VLI39_19515 [Sedimentisphaerales bacterium]|nr:hypothetical protein [Sedimentisphaerales bacterium]
MVQTIVSAACMMLVATAGVAEDRLAGETYAVVVSGVGKDPQDLVARGQVLSELRTYLSEKAFVKPERLTVLAPDAATAQEVKNAIDAVVRTARETDRFVFYYIGQANPAGGSLRLNLPGPDVTQDDWARWLSGVKARTQLVVLDCPCAAAAAKALARPGRVVVMAATETQVYSPRFSLHFVPALARPQSDTNHDGRVSVLEAFTATAREIEQWYRQMKLLPTETPCIEDNGDGRPSEQPWRYPQDGCDGRLAAEFVVAPGS